MSKAQSKSYHHGGVKLALIDAAIDALKTQSLEAVSMRKLAVEIGVSHNAPYMHFPDKEALWLAISDVGFELLMADITRAIAPLSDWKGRLIAGCEAYVRFGEKNREHMLVMFRSATPGVERSMSPKGTEALDLLSRELSRGVSTGQLDETDPERFAVLIWTILHGLTMSQLQLGGTRGPLLMLPSDGRMSWILEQVLPLRS